MIAPKEHSFLNHLSFLEEKLTAPGLSVSKGGEKENAFFLAASRDQLAAGLSSFSPILFGSQVYVSLLDRLIILRFLNNF